jgi:hypothetical protein
MSYLALALLACVKLGLPLDILQSLDPFNVSRFLFFLFIFDHHGDVLDGGEWITW